LFDFRLLQQYLPTTDMEDNVVPQVLIRLIGTDRRD
jgi:hypothetical protein